MLRTVGQGNDWGRQRLARLGATGVATGSYLLPRSVLPVGAKLRPELKNA